MTYKRHLATLLGVPLALSILLTGCIFGIDEIDDTDSGFGVSFEDSVQVVYSVEVSGSASVDEVQWLEDGELLVDDDPSQDGWSRTVQAEPGSDVSLSADASADGGTVRLSYRAIQNGEVIGQALLDCSTDPCEDFSIQDTLPE